MDYIYGSMQQTNNTTSWVVRPTAADWTQSPSAGTALPSARACATLVSWDAIHLQLKWGLLMHVYGFAILFFVLAFYAFFSILNLRSLISSRPFMATINGFLCLLGASRAASLFIDPYSLSHSMPKAFGALLWDVGFPCVTSAFCLIQLAFLRLTQTKAKTSSRLVLRVSPTSGLLLETPWACASKYLLNLGPEKLRRKSCLSLVITAHFSCIIGADIAVALHEQLLPAKLALQGMFVVWGILLCATFLYGGHRVRQLVRNVPSGLFANGPLDTRHKGIMQLAMLAPYNNLASSVAAALVPTLLTPKIRITDENEQTFSYASADGSDVPLHAAPNRAVAGPSTSRVLDRVVSPERSSHCSRKCTWQQQQKLQRQRLPSEEDEADCSLLAAATRSSSAHPNSDLAALPAQPDFTLHTVLNHIALVSRSAADDDSCVTGKKSQVQQVLSVTTATAVLGLVLCGAELTRVLSNSYGTMAATLVEPRAAVWPWFVFQTTCRSLEFTMGCAMAAVTKQPVVRPPQPFAAAYSLRPKPTLYM